MSIILVTFVNHIYILATLKKKNKILILPFLLHTVEQILSKLQEFYNSGEEHQIENHKVFGALDLKET